MKYLCEYCDEEFPTVEQCERHERNCRYENCQTCRNLFKRKIEIKTILFYDANNKPFVLNPKFTNDEYAFYCKNDGDVAKFYDLANDDDDDDKCVTYERI